MSESTLVKMPHVGNHMSQVICFFVSDIDECVEVPDICKNGQCQNTFGSFICICPLGYRLDTTTQECVGKCSLGYKTMQECVSIILATGRMKLHRCMLLNSLLATAWMKLHRSVLFSSLLATV